MKDILIYLVCVAVGYLIGVMKPVFSDWLTDWRREIAERKKKEKIFNQIKSKMPELFSDMKKDCVKPENKFVRTMVISDGPFGHYKRVINIIYKRKERDDLFEMIDMLENYGYIQMTQESDFGTKEYHITDEFFELIIKN